MPQRLPSIKPSPSLLRHLRGSWNSSQTACRPSRDICRQGLQQGEFDGSIVDDLSRNESHKFLYILPCLGSAPGREMKQ
jgi:hypothetical protein